MSSSKKPGAMPLVRSIVRKIWEMRSRAEEATQKKARRVRRIKPMEARKRQRKEKTRVPHSPKTRQCFWRRRAATSPRDRPEDA